MKKLHKPPSVFIADDEPCMRMYIRDVMKKEGFTVTEYDPYNPQNELLRKHYNLAVLDLAMPGMNGFELANYIMQYSSQTQFIIVTAFPDQKRYDQAVAMNVHTFLVKPFGIETIRYAARGALHQYKLNQKKNVEVQITSKKNVGLVGESSHMISIRTRILELAPLEIPILITGESGTGKDLVAQCIHQNSDRVAEPYIPLNCGSLSPSLIESELFGYVRGAFTGANKTKYGFFEAAHGGTLFLDEIGELPLELQSKFLRVLDSGEFIRIGETLPRKVNIRIVSATNRNIEAMVEQGTFRKDLYFRLRGGLISLTPLRKRKEDIPDLLRHFVGKPITITDNGLEFLKNYGWPGNIRELSMVAEVLKGNKSESVINEKIVNKILHPLETQDRCGPIDSYQQAKNRVLKEFEKKYFVFLLKTAEYNLSKAANLAGMDRKNLRNKLKNLGLYPL